MSAVKPFEAKAWPWPDGVSPVDGGVCAAKGFEASGTACGIKKGDKLDIAVLACEAGATTAGVFTTNAFAAAPVHVARTHIARGPIKAVVVNSGNANACTGTKGIRDAVAMAKGVAGALACSPWEVAVASTGVIGVPLPMGSVARGIEDATGALSASGGSAAAEAIMTTDTFPKEVAIEVALESGKVRIGGMAKGSGMIKPDMATMLSFVTTDAGLGAAQAQRLLAAAAGQSFNRITVDGETSTNDCVLLLASGGSGVSVAEGSADEETFLEALKALATFLAQQIVRDGEGATKFVAVRVGGAADEDQADMVAFAVADSPLVKTALFGQDANWGRVLSAVGASGASIDADSVQVSFGPHVVAEAGAGTNAPEDVLSAYLEGSELELAIDLGQGEAEAVVWTTDLTYDYVRINADYRT